jgi:hypothetical protein
MPYSIYHFFKSLINNKKYFSEIEKLEDFPFDNTMLACKNAGQFPDLAIRLNVDNQLFTGGELIELKDSQSYNVSSFNSTIPTGQKDIEKLIKSVNSSIKKQMEEAGNNISSLKYRDVYYLIRGKQKEKIKITLVHGSFFETVNSEELISQSFEKALEETISKHNIDLNEDTKSILLTLFSEQESFSKVRSIDKASVKLRFRIMTEVKAEGNILNKNQYPEIDDNTINLVVPLHGENEILMQRFNAVFDTNEVKQYKIFVLKHHLNGHFLVFQTNL